MPYLNTLAREAMPPMAGQQWNPVHNFDRSQYRGSNFPRDTGLFGNSREGVLDGTAQAPIGTTKGINVGNTVHGTHTRYDFDVTPMLDAPSLTSFTFIADFEWTRPSSGILWLIFHISQLGAPTGVYDSLIYIMASVNQLRLGFNNGAPH